MRKIRSIEVKRRGIIISRQVVLVYAWMHLLLKIESKLIDLERKNL